MIIHILFQINNYTTNKIGGPARHFSICDSIEELQITMEWAIRNDLPQFILGNGSNILVSNKGFPGLVIKLGGDFKKVVFGEDADTVQVGGLLPSLSRHFLARGWGGFEFMCVIPGTIGGAVRINAGTKQGEVKDHISTFGVDVTF